MIKERVKRVLEINRDRLSDNTFSELDKIYKYRILVLEIYLDDNEFKLEVENIVETLVKSELD